MARDGALECSASVITIREMRAAAGSSPRTATTAAPPAGGLDADSLGLDGSERVDVVGLDRLAPRGEARMRVVCRDGTAAENVLRVRIDTPIELESYRHGGVLPYVFRRFLPGP
jgi:hypothetical protein